MANLFGEKDERVFVLRRELERETSFPVLAYPFLHLGADLVKNSCPIIFFVTFFLRAPLVVDITRRGDG